MCVWLFFFTAIDLCQWWNEDLLYLAISQKSTLRYYIDLPACTWHIWTFILQWWEQRVFEPKFHSCSSLIPGTHNVIAMKVWKRCRIIEDSCLATHEWIQLQFLVKRCCWREGKGAGWGVGRMKIQNAISLHINRDSCVWEPEPQPVAWQPDSSVSRGHFSCQAGCHYCWFSQFNFQRACLVWYRICVLYVCVY